MLRARTITQLLEVLDRYRKNRDGGESTERALQGAIQKVAERYNVTYQTIVDGCRRRLELRTIEHLHTLLRRWDQEDAASLISLLKKHTEVTNYRMIDDFFDGSAILPSSGPSDLAEPSPAPDPRSDRVIVELDAADFNRLKTLAQIMGSTPSVIAAKFITDTLGRL